LQCNQHQQYLQKHFSLLLKYSKQYRIVLFTFMTMENFPVNADKITHLQTLSKGYVLQLQRNSSIRTYDKLHKQSKRNVRVSQNLC